MNDFELQHVFQCRHSESYLVELLIDITVVQAQARVIVLQDATDDAGHLLVVFRAHVT